MAKQMKQGRRGFLGGLGTFLTWGAFEARAAELAGVVLPEDRLQMPTPETVYMVSSPALDNSDDGAYTNDGYGSIELFYSEEAADKRAADLNRADFRQNFDGWHRDRYEHEFLDSVKPADMAVIREWAPKVLDDDEAELPEADEELLEYLRERACDEAIFFRDIPDHVIDVFVDCSSLAMYSVDPIDPTQVDPALIKDKPA